MRITEPAVDPTLRHVELPQGTLRYRDSGQGRPVVLLHGALVDGRLWRKVVAALEGEGVRCIVPDLPLGAHRLPMHPDADLSPAGVAGLVRDLLVALEVDDVVLVGNDSGGAIAQLVVTLHPERVGALVLTNCDAFEVFPPWPYSYLKAFGRVPALAGVVARALVAMPLLLRFPNAYGWLSRTRIPSALLVSWMEPLSRDRRVARDVGKFLRGALPAVTLAASRALAGFSRPSVVVWGMKDVFFPRALAGRLVSTLPDAHLVEATESATYVPEDEPERVAAAITRLTAAHSTRDEPRGPTRELSRAAR